MVQEENQRSLSASISNSHNLSTMATRTDVNKKPGNNVYKKKERPLCTHCGLNGHTIDTCYKHHGYPPGYKPKPRISKSNPVNMVDSEASNAQSSKELQHLLQNLNPQQYQQLSQMFTTQPTNGNATNETSSAGTTNITCCVNTPSTKSGIISLNGSHTWIIDLGASRNISNNKSLFLNLRTVSQTSILLSDNTSLPVKHVGTIHLTDSITLHNVFYVPNFKFNLLSVSCLLADNPFFYTFHC